MEEIKQNRSKVELIREDLQGKLRSRFAILNNAFNQLSLRSKHIALIAFGVITGAGAIVMMIDPFISERGQMQQVERITTPIDIYPENSMKQNLAQQLIPIGKMKGEIDGKFEAFYIAVDHEGKICINRDPPMGEDRFLKSSGWETISNEEFRDYEKKLHFIRYKQKGLTP